MPKVKAWECRHVYSDGGVSNLIVTPHDEEGRTEISLEIEHSDFVCIQDAEQFAEFMQAMMAAAKQIGWLSNSSE